MDVLEVREGRYHLAPAGREMAEHMQLVIPAFMKWVFSPQTVSLFTLWAHVVLSLLKLGIGYFSRSAGLLADGIDNTVDTLSSLLVWLGIKFNKEKLVSIFIIITMFLSLGGIALAAIEKVIHLEPVKSGLTAFFVSLICGLVMLGLSSYQYLAGKKSSNLAIMCQSVDSRNHFWVSLLVCGGILFSFMAEAFNITWLHYADVLASALIGLLILKGAIELIRVFHEEAEEGIDVSHFMKAMQERHREKILFEWIKAQLHSQAFTQKDLEEKFALDFCKETPKILKLTEFGYRPESGIELRPYLDRFIKQKKLILDNGKYWLIA
jgi:Co/Zn/Cd efflux system component